MSQHPFRLTVRSLDVLLAGEACRFLGMNGNLQNFLAAAKRFDLAVERLESSLLLLGLQGELAKLFGELAQDPLPAEERMIIGLSLVLPSPARQGPR